MNDTQESNLLIPVSAYQLMVEDGLIIGDYEFEGWHFYSVPQDETPEGKKSYLFAVDKHSWLGAPQIQRLSVGEDLEMEHPEGRIAGCGRLKMWINEGPDETALPVFEFVSAESVRQGASFYRWLEIRFWGLEAWQVVRREKLAIALHAMWCAETQPPVATLAPDDSLLVSAVVENKEHLVAAILAKPTRIEVRPGTVTRITETALGAALENIGDIPDTAGWVSGCHRNYRDDDFCLAEDSETWVPRAARIAGMLRVAGAVDYSPLLDACRTGELGEVRRMLDDGFPPNFSIYGTNTALVEAASRGHAEICKLLLERGACPNQPRVFDTSMTWGGLLYPLTCALPHPEISTMLLEAGADPVILCDDYSETPVIFKSRYQTQEAADALFSRVDFSSIRGKLGMTGVHILPAEDLALCRKYIPRELLDQRNQAGMTPLHTAYLYKDLAKVKLLLELGADPNPQGIIWGFKEQGCDFFPIYGQCIATGSLADAASFEGEPELLDALQSTGGKLGGILWFIDLRKELAEGVLEDTQRKLEEDRQQLIEEGREILQIPNSDFQCACYHRLLSLDEHALLKCLVTRMLLDPESTLERYPELMGKFTLDTQSKWQGPFSEKEYPQLSDLIRELSEEDEV